MASKYTTRAQTRSQAVKREEKAPCEICCPYVIRLGSMACGENVEEDGSDQTDDDCSVLTAKVAMPAMRYDVE